MSIDLLIKFYIIAFGLMIGSFINAYVYRYINNLPILNERSICPNCKNRLRWYHNIPILSYIFLKGKCYYCNAKISLKYPLVELLTSVLFYIIYLKFQLSLLTIYYIIVCFIFILISYIDIEKYIIPNRLTISLILISLLSYIFKINNNFYDAVDAALIGVVCALFVYFGSILIFNKEAFGFGDVKLIFALGLILKTKGLIPLLYLSILSAVLFVPITYLKGKKYLPFGPFLCFASLSYILYQNELNYLFYNIMFNFK